jgi:hypothetical protein
MGYDMREVGRVDVLRNLIFYVIYFIWKNDTVLHIYVAQHWSSIEEWEL